jgi:hypothetical protein
VTCAVSGSARPGERLFRYFTQFRKYFEDNPSDLQARIDSIPMARLGDPMDLVGAAIFLASGASNYVSGQTLLVDGGSTLWCKFDRFASGGGNSAALEQGSVLPVKIDQRFEVIGQGPNLSDPADQQIPLRLSHQKAG